VPVFFGVQQAFEGRVWQMLDAGNPDGGVLCTGFHFSHFLWLWWLPLCCYLVESGKVRKEFWRRHFRRLRHSGLSAMLSHPEWMSVAVKGHSIHYSFSVPYRSSFHLWLTPAAVYALTILVPLLSSSNGHIRIFGALVALSMVLASKAFGHAYVSVWCFFAAVLSLYLVYMIRRLVAETKPSPEMSTR
jgi:hypothetical protein